MDSTFYCCSNLSEISIPNSVTSIGNNAFYYCWRLKTITIPNSVTFIGEFAFYSCFVLVDVYCLPENVPETSNTAFGSSSVASATLHVPAASIEAYKVTEPWSEFGSFVALTEDEIVGIKEIEKEQRTKDNKDCEFYDIQGRKATELRRGLNIIRYFDGTRRKVLLK